LVIASASVKNEAERNEDGQLLEATSLMSRLVSEMRDATLNVRMVQIGETFNRYRRIVRDLSHEMGKDIDLVISGGDTELDKTVIEKITDPLTHLVRNAVDHGIDSAEKRKERGKSPKGTIWLNAYHETGSIVIEVSDDGRGLNKDKLVQKAVERGVIQSGQQLSDKEIYQLIFQAGFSTADKVSDVSGRGVGMDVVKRNIEALRGLVDIESEEGKGTKVRIRLPLTLAIIDGFFVGVGSTTWVVPLDMVLECLEFDEANLISSSDDKEEREDFFNLRGEVLPFLRLNELFGEEVRSHEQLNIVVVQYAGHKAGLLVDRLMGEYQTVIKPLGPIFQNLRGISGATIMGSGEIALIIDVPRLVQFAKEKEEALETQLK
jgi:two-component system chemotaxis sensor kinase CheA